MSGFPNLEIDTMSRELQQERERLENIKRRWQRYHGDYDDLLKRRRGQPDMNVKVNKARTIVETSAFFLYGRGIEFELSADEAAESETTEDEQILDEIWRFNRRDAFLHKMAVSGGVTGHIFVQIVPPSPDEGRPYPRFILTDASFVTPKWNEDDIDDILSYRIQFNSTREVAGRVRPIVKRKLIQRDGAGWRIIDQWKLMDARDWVTETETTWPFFWPPIIDAQNLPVPESFWGLSDIEDDVLSLVKAKNQNLSLWMEELVYFGRPIVFTTGMGQSQELDLSKTINLPEGGDLKALEKQSRGQGAQLFNDTINQEISEISQTPLVALGQADKLGPLSGVALQVQYQPLIQKTLTKRMIQGPMLAELSRRALELMGRGDDLVPAVQWRDVLPQNEKEDAETALLDQELGASQDTLLQRRGYDPEVEREKRQLAEQDLGERLLRRENAGFGEE